MRERTAFPRAVIEALPDLKLLITTGMRNASIDLEAAKESNVVVCGTPAFGNATAALAIGLMLELARHIGYENARLKAGAAWQTTIGLDLEGLTLSRSSASAGSAPSVAQIGKAFGHERHRLEPESHRRKVPATPASSYVSRDDLFRRADFLSIHVAIVAAHAAA